MKYRVQEVEGFEGGDGEPVRVFHVEWETGDWRRTASAQVWWHDKLNYGNCTDCSGVFVAMSSSCPHVLAVKRHVAKAAPTQ